MADNSLPQDAAKRLLELKKKLLAGSRSSEKLNTTVSEPVKSLPVETTSAPSSAADAVPSAPVKKQPLTMKSLMSSRRSSRRASEEGIQEQPQPEISPVVPAAAFVSRLKEAPAHRTVNGSKPKVISLTKTFVTTTQEREARQAEEEAAEKEQVKRPKLSSLVKPIAQVIIFQRTSGLGKFTKEHSNWLHCVIDNMSEPADGSPANHFDRSDPSAFINQHKQFIKII